MAATAQPLGDGPGPPLRRYGPSRAAPFPSGAPVPRPFRGPCLTGRRPPETRKVLLVARLFGTDGVRGLANGLLTAELALDLSVAAAHVLAEKGVFEGHRPVAVVGRDPRASGRVPLRRRHRRAGLRRCRRPGRRHPAHTGHRVPDRGPRRRPRRHALGLAQRHAGQRHQVLRPRRPQAGRRDRGRHRGTARRAVGAPHRSRRRPCPPPGGRPGALPAAPALGAAAPPRRPARRGRRRARGREQRRPRRLRAGRGPRQHHRLRAGRPQHQRRLRLHPPGEPPAGGRASTAPTWASRSTGTPTVAWRSTPRARTWMATRS